MGKPTSYRQCRLNRAVSENGGVAVSTSWIPSQLATVGKVLSFKDLDGKWTVVEVYEGTQTAEELALLRGDQRTMSCVLGGCIH